MTLDCVERLIASTSLPLEVIVVDNGSILFDRSLFDALGVCVVTNQSNKGFAGGVNSGLKWAHGDLILLFNSDALPSHNMIDQFVTDVLSDNTIGIIGPRTNNTDGSYQISSGKFPSIIGELVRFTPLYKYLPLSTYLPMNKFTKKYFAHPSDIDWVSGGCMAIRRACLEDVGNFDARYFFGVEDWDYCYRAKKRGWRVVFDAHIEITHAHSISAGGKRTYFKEEHEKIGTALFYRKHYRGARILPRLSNFWYVIRMRRAN